MDGRTKTPQEKKELFLEGLKKIVEAKEKLGMTHDVTYIKAKEQLENLTKNK